jgi:hypothetical protein
MTERLDKIWRTIEQSVEMLVAESPDGQIDLQAAVERRLAAKNNQLAAEAPALRERERR